MTVCTCYRHIPLKQWSSQEFIIGGWWTEISMARACACARARRGECYGEKKVFDFSRPMCTLRYLFSEALNSPLLPNSSWYRSDSVLTTAAPTQRWHYNVARPSWALPLARSCRQRSGFGLGMSPSWSPYPHFLVLPYFSNFLTTPLSYNIFIPILRHQMTYVKRCVTMPNELGRHSSKKELQKWRCACTNVGTYQSASLWSWLVVVALVVPHMCPVVLYASRLLQVLPQVVQSENVWQMTDYFPIHQCQEIVASVVGALKLKQWIKAGVQSSAYLGTFKQTTVHCW